MVTFKTSRRAAMTRVGRLPDDRAVVGCAVTALVALLLMLLAGAAQAEQTEFVCREAGDGKLECENVASATATCANIDQKHEPCTAVQGAGSATPSYLPGNITTVKPTQAGKEIWSRNKPHVNIIP